jgi:hypothetical protein
LRGLWVGRRGATKDYANRYLWIETKPWPACLDPKNFRVSNLTNAGSRSEIEKSTRLSNV